ncbi:Lrp/AsnC family transcriptional regulator [uncultured Umboniibacter sp.]|uniref:Lrp/AsnC family transcriptional regulator n=1 Tax=uncultured Umboniibacter sp. TaxID=1798917 RepID=UPI002634B5DA|nr:Lrp/AsnC family transcriptional regulator [uncultured Umboniibacter sp.]
MDLVDQKIVRLLQRDARLSNTELAEAVNLSPSPCSRRVRKLERSGVITGYHARVNPVLTGRNVSALVSVKLRRNGITEAQLFEAAIQQMDYVTECSTITGRYDYMLRLHSESLEDLEAKLKTELAAIEAIDDMETTIILKSIKHI